MHEALDNEDSKADQYMESCRVNREVISMTANLVIQTIKKQSYGGAKGCPLLPHCNIPVTYPL